MSERAKLNVLVDKYKNFSSASGLPVKKERMSVAGFRSVKVDTKALINTNKSGMIELGSDKMGISIEIDKFTPCIVERKTGKIINTSYSLVKEFDLKELNNKGWKFDWTTEDLKQLDIYKLTIKNSDEIQGLVALEYFPKDKAIYISLAENAPNNLGLHKQYEGVGGHLFAIAAEISNTKGYGGFLFMDAKNMELVSYYSEKFGATLLGMPHQYRMYIDETNAQNLLKIYNLKGE